MPHSPGKFCIDRNLVRWSLLHGIITRKTSTDSPLDGQNLPVSEVTGIEKTTVVKVDRPRFGWPAILTGIAVLVIAWQIDSLPLRILIGVMGFASVYWGSLRIRARRTVHDAYQIIVGGMKPEEWTVVGSSPETIGFIEAVRSELAGNRDSPKARMN